MGCLRGHAIQLNDLQILARHEILDRWNSNIKSPKEEAIKGFRKSVDGFLQGGPNRIAAIEKDRTPAVSPDLDQLNSFPRYRHVLSPLQVVAQVKVRHADCPIVCQDQFFERPAAVSNHNGHALFCHRKYAASFFIGVTNVENPKLAAGNMFLDNDWKRCTTKILAQLLRRTNNGDARAALPRVGLQHNWKAELVILHECFCLRGAML